MKVQDNYVQNVVILELSYKACIRKKMVDNELKYQYTILKQLEKELMLQETMQERAIVRQDIKATKNKINRLLKEKQNGKENHS